MGRTTRVNRHGFCTLRCTLTLKSLRFLVILEDVSRYFPRNLAFTAILTRWKSLVRIQCRPIDPRQLARRPRTVLHKECFAAGFQDGDLTASPAPAGPEGGQKPRFAAPGVGRGP